MSKSDHINKYVLLKGRGVYTYRLWDGKYYIPGRFTEVWRMDNKNAHLHRVYDDELDKFVYPTENMSVRVGQLRDRFDRYKEVYEFESKDDYTDAMFLVLL